MNELKYYEIVRYHELKELIIKHNYKEIGIAVDTEIIKKTDLKRILINSIKSLEIKKYDNLEQITNLCRKVYSKEELKEIEEKLLYLEIENGAIYNDVVNYEKVLSYALNKFKDPNYSPKVLADKLVYDPKFIEYCLSNKYLNVFRFIEMDPKYYDIVYKLIEEGYGFNTYFSLPLDMQVKLLKMGYINSFDYSSADISNEEYYQIIKNLIDNNQDIHHVNLYLVQDMSERLFNYIMDNKKYKYLDLINPNLFYSNDFKKERQKRLEEAAKENKEVEKYITSASLVNDEELGIKCCFQNDFFYIPSDMIARHKDFIIKELKKKDLSQLYNSEIINERLVKLILDINDKDFLQYIMNNNINNFLTIYNYINHHQNNHNNLIKYYTKDFYLATKDKFEMFYNINNKHLDILTDKFGYKILCYLENDNINKLLNLDDESFNKYINMFNIDKLTIEDAQNIYDSIVQSRFKSEYKHDIERLARIKLSLGGKQDNYFEDLKELAFTTNIERLKHIIIKDKKINNKDFINTINNKESLYKFLLDIYNNIKNNIDVEENYNILYAINKENIKEKREEFRLKNNYLDELELDYRYEEKSLRDAWVLETFKSYISKEDILSTLQDKKIDYELAEGVDNITLFKAVMDFLTNDTQDLEYLMSINPNLTYPKLKSKIKQVREILGDSSRVKMQKEWMSDDEIGEKYNVKKIFYPKYDESKIYDLLCEINPNELRDTVFNNKEIEDSLLNVLKKYKFINWQDVFKDALTTSKLDYEYYTIATLISKYAEIYKETINKEDDNTTLMSILNYADVLSSSSSRYTSLLGTENARLIKLNPEPNSAPIMKNREERLEIAVKDYYDLLKRKKITVPPIDKTLIINDKLIEINLGNFSDPINLTYGERTGACMRINGAADTLYNFCKDNINGFHIRLMDPTTNELISRVSGYRNGNTVFLNQLKESQNFKYDNIDLIKAIEKTADIIIESTKDSNRPIENVFISGDCALLESDKPLEKIEQNILEGFDVFYFDYINDAICLKTTSPNKIHKPVDTNKDGIDVYDVLRDKTRVSNDKKEIYEYINQYRMVKDMLSSNDENAYTRTKLISLEEVENIEMVVKGEDFIACLDKNLNINTDYIDNNDKRMLDELKKACKLLDKYKEGYINGRSNRNSRQI